MYVLIFQTDCVLIKDVSDVMHNFSGQLDTELQIHVSWGKQDNFMCIWNVFTILKSVGPR